MPNKQLPHTQDNLNVPHKVTLTEGQISTILYVLEGYIQGNDDYDEDSEFHQDVNNIFAQLEQVVDGYYDKDDPLEITPFQEELEVKKFIRDNDNTPEKVTQTQLQSIKGDLL